MNEQERQNAIRALPTYGNQAASHIKSQALKTPGKTLGATAIEILQEIGEAAELNSLVSFATKNVNADRARGR